jgi:hypothetical protein
VLSSFEWAEPQLHRTEVFRPAIAGAHTGRISDPAVDNPNTDAGSGLVDSGIRNRPFIGNHWAALD